MNKLTDAQQNKAIKFLRQMVDQDDEARGDAPTCRENDALFHDARMLLIEVGAIPDRRKLKPKRK